MKIDILDRCARFRKQVTRRAPTWHCLGKMINRRLKNLMLFVALNFHGLSKGTAKVFILSIYV